MKKNKIPIGTSKRKGKLPADNQVEIVEQKKAKPAINLKKSRPIKKQASQGTYDNPQSSYQRQSHV